MASVLKLKTDIKKLKAAIASKATSGAIKTKLRGKLTTLENELDKLQPNKRKPKTTGPKSESALVKLAKKRRTNQGLSTSKSDIERDAIRPAKPAGRRISADGNRYYEYRDNRVDTRQPPKKYRKLADGGQMDKYSKPSFESKEGIEITKKAEKVWASMPYDERVKYLNKKLSNQKGVTDEANMKIISFNAEKPWEDLAIRFQMFVEEDIYTNKMADGGMMAKGGKTKDQEVVRGYFEGEAYEYADGGMVEKLRKEFSTKELDDNLMLDGYKTEVFDYTEEKEAKRWVKNNSKDNYVVPYENYDDNYIFVLVPKNKMADGGSVAKGNYEMLMSQAKEVMHHAEELMQVAKPDMDVEAWVVAKAERATTDLSDITHYLDGLKMAMGGMVKHNAHKVNA
jgi:hypothetical protein